MTAGARKETQWVESHVLGQGAAYNHCLIEWNLRDGAMVIKANGIETLRLCIKYNADGPYIAIEQNRAAATGESFAACERAGRMASQYDAILKAHNAVSELLQSGRRFIVAKSAKADAA